MPTTYLAGMKTAKIIFTAIFMIALNTGNAQMKQYVFKDTFQIDLNDENPIYELEMDTLDNRENRRVKFCFTVAPTDSILFIERAFTSDPHYICDWPKEALQSGVVYEFSVCYVRKIGPDRKTMGFIMSNGTRVSFRFKSHWLGDY